MPANAELIPNVKQSVPFFMVTDIEASYRFYVDGLGFTMTHEWRPERAGGSPAMVLAPAGGRRAYASGVLEGWTSGRRPGGTSRTRSLGVFHMR